MKYAFTIFLLVITLSLNAQTDGGFAKRIESWYKPIKGDSVWVSQCECSNVQYNEYVNSLKAKGDRQNYILNRPDSTGWNFSRIFPRNTNNNSAIGNTYHTDQKYANYPVVNINFSAAIDYCNWLTQQYNSSAERKFKRVVFRLPDADQWEFAARGKPSKKEIADSSVRVLPWPGGYTFKDAKGNYMANFAPMHDASVKRDEHYYLVLPNAGEFGSMAADGYGYTAPCDKTLNKSYKPNEFGLYHLAGNVSEFILESGKTKGGSYISPGHYLLINTDDPEFRDEMMGGPFIGFRPFMFVVER